jgi:hypothetical protein
MDREIPKLKFYYINLRGCVCKTYLTFTLLLKQRCKSSIFTPYKEQSILHNDMTITKDPIILLKTIS